MSPDFSESIRNFEESSHLISLPSVLIAEALMFSSEVLEFPTYSACTYAAGIAGNLFAFVLFVSPIPTFRRIVTNRSTEQFSGLPYIYGLLNCLICLWYGTPIVCPGVLLVLTVNSIGAVFQLGYASVFIVFAEKGKKKKMTALLLAVFGIFAVIVFVTLTFFENEMRRIVVGYLSVASLISMFASPLFIINLVIRTRSTEFMPFYLSLSTFLMSVSFLVYGVLKDDAFLYFPNGVGTLLGVVQLVLYSYYSKPSREDSTEPLIASYV